MDKNLIKAWLINKKPKAYSIIVQIYFEQLTSLQTSRFIEWLALELDVPDDAVNKSSLSSALRRYRERLAKRSNRSNSKPTVPKSNPFDHDLPDKIEFT